MTLTISPPVRIAAICGLLFTVLVFGGLRLLGGSGGGETSVTSSKVIKHHPFGAGAKTKHKSATPAATPKTHKASKKRFRVTASGLLKRVQAGKKHLNSHKTGKRKRHLREEVVSGNKFARK